MSDEKHTCCERLYKGGYHARYCGRGAKYEHGGKWYCGTHHPPTVHRKRVEREKKFHEECVARRKRQDESAAKMAEIHRRSECYDALLAACYLVIRDPNIHDDALAVVKAAIEKATGELT